MCYEYEGLRSCKNYSLVLILWKTYNLTLETYFYILYITNYEVKDNEFHLGHWFMIFLV
jgi:hypothetical protein